LARRWFCCWLFRFRYGRCAFRRPVRSYREGGFRAKGAIEPCDTARETDHWRDRSFGGISWCG
jgi:hypothetical protein